MAELNIVDESGREIVKGTRYLLGDGDTITFTGVTPEMHISLNKSCIVSEPRLKAERASLEAEQLARIEVEREG